MSYEYKVEREKAFTDEGQRTFLAIRDRVKRLLAQSGAVTMGAAINGATGDSWVMLACVDRLVELGEIREIPQTHAVAGQNRIFISGRE